MHTNRRTFVTGSLAATAAAGLPWRPALAQGKVELKLASFVPPKHTIWANVLTPWTKEVEKKSGGKLTIRMFPSMQLGGKAPELYRQMVQGIADIIFTLPGYTSSDFPMMSLTELPGTASSADDGTRKLWKHMNFFSKEYKDAKVLMLWNSDNAGFMTKDKPIRKIADVKGLRLRAPSAAQAAQIEHLGGIGVSMPVTQIYNSIERGTVDGTQIPLSAMLDFKLLEVVQHLTVNAPLGRSPFLVSMQRKKYESLPADLRKVIDDTTGLQLSLKGSEAYDKKNTLALAAAKKDRDVYELSDKERQEWLAYFAPLVKKEAARVDKAGLPGSDLVKAYGLTA
jgi:TRAP-type transport system periplasmic protein